MYTLNKSNNLDNHDSFCKVVFFGGRGSVINIMGLEIFCVCCKIEQMIIIRNKHFLYGGRKLNIQNDRGGKIL